jgi:hypothetical protein
MLGMDPTPSHKSRSANSFALAVFSCALRPNAGRPTCAISDRDLTKAACQIGFSRAVTIRGANVRGHGAKQRADSVYDGGIWSVQRLTPVNQESSHVCGKKLAISQGCRAISGFRRRPCGR